MIFRLPLPKLTAILSAAVFSLISTLALAELEIETKGGGERSVAKQVSASIIEIDREEGDITLQGPMGNRITLHVGDTVERLDEFEVGDLVVATYIASLSGELREPTPAEVEVPWAELDVAAIAGAEELPGAGAGSVIRAVCTIEGMNRITRTVTVLDPLGNFHIIGDVDPERMTNVSIGQTIILTYTRATALSLEKVGG
ncbi:MAG: hypothetical protein Hals2KO_12620 [Halioglobus sp.]